MEHRLKVFSESGDLVRVVGQKGEGPGDLNFPTVVRYLDGKIYVRELNYISVFDDEGHHLGKVKLGDAFVLRKIRNGWIRFVSDRTQSRLKWHSEDMAKTKELLSLDISGSPVFKNGQRMLNPIRDVAIPIIDSSNGLAYVSQPGAFVVFVIDLNKLEVIRTIENHEHSKIPADMKQLQKDFEQIASAIKKRAPQIKLVPDIPDYLPPIRHMATRPSGGLLVFTNTKAPDKHDVYAFDKCGNQTTTMVKRFSDTGRIIGTNSEWVFVTAYPDEEFAIAKVRQDQVQKFIKENPIQ